jgi:hypothetical protein
MPDYAAEPETGLRPSHRDFGTLHRLTRWSHGTASGPESELHSSAWAASD